MKVIVVVLIVFSATIGRAQANDNSDPEIPQIKEASADFVNSTHASIQRLADADFEHGLKQPAFGANADQIFETQLKQIKKSIPLDTVDVPMKVSKYDVIIQPGHYGRPPGKLGTHGKSVTEQELVAYIAGVVAERLRHDSLSVLVISADKYPRPLPMARIFLAIHAEGTDNRCRAKASMAYGRVGSIIGSWIQVLRFRTR
jgi:N-acetylmuramoyl-L-alanine amidase